jgi:putative transposase
VIYPIVYLNCIVVKIRQDKQVINKAVYLALGVNMEGHKELLGLWLPEDEGAKFLCNLIKYVPWKDYKPVTVELKRIYEASTKEEALRALDQFAARWDEKYPQISRRWQAHRQNLNTLFNYPQDIRKAIYMPNAIKSLNSVIRTATKKRKLFPTDNSAKKAIYLVFQAASKIVDDADPELEAGTQQVYDHI